MQKQRAFTLIELLLVIMILGLVAAITLPNFVGSIGSHRLKTAARTLVSTGRYTRSMAVMKQESMVLTFDLDLGTITVNAFSAPKQSPSDSEEETPEEEMSFEENSETPKDNSFGSELFHQLDRVLIDSVEIDNEEENLFTEGQCSVIYYSNGRCIPYTVNLMDEKGHGITVSIDALSSVKAE